MKPLVRLWVGHWAIGLILRDMPRYGPWWWREFYIGPVVITNARRRHRRDPHPFIWVDR